MDPIILARWIKHNLADYTINDILDYYNILLIEGDFHDFMGGYRMINRSKVIIINQHLSPADYRSVLFHELGHALLHTKEECYLYTTTPN